MKETIAINNLRTLACDMISNVKSGHPGIALGATPIYLAILKSMKSSAKHSNHILRDRFVLSAGHGSSMLYAGLHLLGYNITMDDLKKFRQMGSITTGHPEVNVCDGVDVSTGPLGQGVANAVGFAVAEKYMASNFNKPDCNLFDNYTFCLLGDGCLMEGIANEALSFAGTNKLNKLIFLYDFNAITIDGSISQTFNQNTIEVLKGYGLNVLEVENGNSVSEIEKAINKAKESDKPNFIIVKTLIGFGSPYEGQAKIHGNPLKEEGLKILRENLKINTKPFEILPETKEYFDELKETKEKVFEDVVNKLKYYKKHYKKEYKQLLSFFENNSKVEEELENLVFDKDASTRNLSSIVLNHLSKNHLNIIGGTADVSASTKAYINDGGNFGPNLYSGRNILYGVREHAMGAISNGIALYGGLRPFASTFFAFSDYMKNAVRMSALMNLPVLYIFSHDSIAVGEDGPTHQSVEQLVQFRAMPNINVFRPCNMEETKAGYLVSLTTQKPLILALSRQVLPYVQSTMQNAMKGGYIISKENMGELHSVLIATGSEVHLALDAQKVLFEKGYNVRVVSMPCMEIFDEQTDKYKNKVIPRNCVSRIAIEAGSELSWFKYVGLNGDTITVNSFGFSAREQDLYNHFNITVENIVNVTIKNIKKNKTKTLSIF